VSKVRLAVLMVLFACSGPAVQAREPRPSMTTGSAKPPTSRLCSTGKQVDLRDTVETFEADRTHVFQIIEDGQAKFPLGAVDMWSTDLNGDGANDLALLVRDTCASGGCMYGVYVSCGGSRYVVAFEPTYTGDLRLAQTTTRLPSGELWRDLEDEHTVDYQENDGALRQRLEVSNLRFDGTRYRRSHPADVRR
jgi:hypothetical protein